MTSLPSVPPEVMPTADSVADAETLRLFDRDVSDVGEMWMAGHYGRLAIYRIEHGDVLDGPSHLATVSARLAFAAIPDLRIPDFQSAEDR